MKYADRPVHLKKWSAPKEAERIRLTSHNEEEACLNFEYYAGIQPRRISLLLERDEAMTLIQ